MMTLLESTSLTARQLLIMPVAGISKSDHHKVHALRADGLPICGGGFMGSRVNAWQNDIGPINCAACVKIKEGRLK